MYKIKKPVIPTPNKQTLQPLLDKWDLKQFQLGRIKKTDIYFVLFFIIDKNITKYIDRFNLSFSSITKEITFERVYVNTKAVHPRLVRVSSNPQGRYLQKTIIDLCSDEINIWSNWIEIDIINFMKENFKDPNKGYFYQNEFFKLYPKIIP